VDQRIQEQDLRDHFYYFGEIASINMVSAQHCAFIEFTTREAAGAAVAKLGGSLIVKGVFLKVAWAKPAYMNETLSVSSPLPRAERGSYPSMDPERMGATIQETASSQTKPLAAPNWSATATN